MAQSLKGKVAIVTGAGKGIGRATAIALAQEGVKVGLIARTEADLVQVVEEIESAGGTATYFAADVASQEEVENAVSRLTDELGSIDILINNAAMGAHGPFMELEPDVWRKIFDVNILGVVHMTQAVLPQLIDKNGGDVINISSSSGLRGTAGSSAYSASKFGLLGLTESLRQEVRSHNIRVFALTPSRVITEFSSSEKPENHEEKFMQPEDIAEYMMAQLKLHPRIFIPTSSQWATNPF
ncbi:3-ketoacyl-ACP reductase [Planococcus lenghuensis]|uniref:3-ketoacyl-ACP reductase n=1 Tax=Planococcus lenghuensis TaxID=2213202 RepID=A0A1Q2L0A1_9BACL|nr:3-ketoacyl-ACP reductase [Planococcus lenghuensis]AQQ53487.1 3-ketoacyl-ACP reductase [Planococcus lenghuensis]